MYTLNYEDSGTAPVSQSLKYVMDKDVQMVFAGGANNLARLVCSQEENERIIVFYDMPPNNLVACEYYKTVVQTLAERHSSVCYTSCMYGICSSSEFGDQR